MRPPATQPNDPVEILLFRLNMEAPIPAAAIALLDDDEQRRALRFRDVKDRHRYCVARAALRAVLAERLCRHPSSLRFVVGSGGKPRLEGEEIAFNVSHSGARVAVALSSCPVGIDVERTALPKDWSSLAASCFSREEAARLHRSSQPPIEFMRIWTAKEATIKADGRGLALPLDRFTVPDFTFDWRPIMTDIDPLAGLHVAGFDLGDGHAGAVAAFLTNPPPRIQWADFGPAGQLIMGPAPDAAICRS